MFPFDDSCELVFSQTAFSYGDVDVPGDFVAPTDPKRLGRRQVIRGRAGPGASRNLLKIHLPVVTLHVLAAWAGFTASEKGFVSTLMS